MSVRPAESPRVAAAAHSRQMASPSPTGRRLPPLDSRAVWLSPKEWDPTLRRNSTCEVVSHARRVQLGTIRDFKSHAVLQCYRSIAYCPGIDAQCLLCPVVVHITCLDQEERKKAFNNNFLCAFCVDDFEYNRDQFLEQRSSQSQKVYLSCRCSRIWLVIISSGYAQSLQAKYTCAQITISARWRGYHALKVYRIVMGLIRRLQNAVRARYRVKLLTQYRIGLLRPMHISVLRCNHLAVGDSSGRADPYVLMTIIDTNNTDNQCWLFKTQVRHQSLNPTYFERFMVPGISGKQTVVLTIVDEDDVRHQCLGQASVRMSNPGDLWKDGGSFVLPISRVKYIPKVAGTPLRLDYSSITPEGSIEVYLLPCFGEVIQLCVYFVAD